jgi:hypothetical protein
MVSNLFDQVFKVQAGETVGPITLEYADYPRSAGWTLKCIVYGEAGKEADVAATAGDSANSFSLTIPAATTAVWRGGAKSYVVEATGTGATPAVYIAERGALTVLWNPRVTTAEMTILASIRAVIAGYALDGQRTTLIDGIQLQYMNGQQLIDLEARYIRIVNSQIGKAGGNGGLYRIQIHTPQDNRYAAPWFGPNPPNGGR